MFLNMYKNYNVYNKFKRFSDFSLKWSYLNILKTPNKYLLKILIIWFVWLFFVLFFFFLLK